MRRVQAQQSGQPLGPDLLEPDAERTIPPAWYLPKKENEASNQPLFVVESEGTEVDLAGYLEVDLPSTGAIEIFARAIGVKGGGFDQIQNARPPEAVMVGDFELDSVIGGSVPGKFDDATDRDVYGFAVSDNGVVSYPRTEELWARITNLPTATRKGRRTGYLSLHALFGRVETDQQQDEQIRVEVHPLFADTRARRVELRFRTISRFQDSFTPLPRIVGDTVDLRPAPQPQTFAIEGAFDNEVMAPASSRPAAPRHQDAEPVIARSRQTTNGPRPVMTSDRVSRMRLWLERPWDTSGRDEMLGIVIWPPLSSRYPKSKSPHAGRDFLRPSASATPDPKYKEDFVSIESLEARELAGAATAVTRWGSDPVEAFNPGGDRPLPKRQPWHDWSVPPSLFADFRLDHPTILAPLPTRPDASFVPKVRMPIPDEEQEEAVTFRQRFLNVDLLAYRPRFDVDSERWYVDVDLDPGIMINPFIQLGVVRFNAMAPRDLQLSFPGTPFDFQVPSRRSLRVETARENSTHALVKVVVMGSATPELVYKVATNDSTPVDPTDGHIADRNVATRMKLRIECQHRIESSRAFKAEKLASPSKRGIVDLIRAGDTAGGGGLEGIIDTLRHGATDTTWSAMFRVPLEAVMEEDYELQVYAEEIAYRPEADPDPEHLDAMSGKSPRWLDTLPVPVPALKRPGS